MAAYERALEQFLVACGSVEPLRIGVGKRDSMELTLESFTQPFIVVGRSSDCDLALDNWQVSRRHAYIQLIEGRYYCLDLGSRTGTHGGNPSKRGGWLEPGHVLQIGPFALRPETPANPQQALRQPPNITWELPHNAVGQAAWRMDRYMALIGRSPACKIRILEPDVSTFHCSVVLTSYGLWVVDLLGEHGVFVNGQRVRCSFVNHGDELRVGSHVLRPRYDRPPLPLPSVEPRTKASASLGFGATTSLPDSIPVDLVGENVQPSMLQPTTPGPLGSFNLPARIVSVPSPITPSTTELITMVEQTTGGAIDPSVNLLVHQFGMMQQNMMDQFHNTMMMMFEGFAALHREQAALIRDEFDQVRKLSDEIAELRVQTEKLAKEKENAARYPRRPDPLANGPVKPFVPRPQPAHPQQKPLQPGQPPMGHDEQEVDAHAQLCMKLASAETERQNRWQKILGMMSAK